MIKAKTAELFAAAANPCKRLPAMARLTRRVRRYGQSLGIAFQLVDDAPAIGNRCRWENSLATIFARPSHAPVILAGAGRAAQSTRCGDRGRHAVRCRSRVRDSYVEETGVTETMVRARHHANEARRAGIVVSKRDPVSDIADFCRAGRTSPVLQFLIWEKKAGRGSAEIAERRWRDVA